MFKIAFLICDCCDTKHHTFPTLEDAQYVLRHERAKDPTLPWKIVHEQTHYVVVAEQLN
jgi:hypothetical protein